MRKIIVLFLLLIAAVGLSGCNTLKGFSQDVRTAWNQASKADAWLQQKAW